MGLKDIRKPDLDKLKKIKDVELPEIEVDEEKVFSFFRNKKVLGGIGALLVVVCSLGFYFGYWVRRPVYSLENMRKAMVAHDVAVFEEYVNLDSLYGTVLEDALAAEDMAADSFSSVVAGGLSPERSEETKIALKEATIAAVRGEAVAESKLEPYGVIGKTVALFCETMVSPDSGYAFSGWRVPSVRDGYADVEIVFVDKEKQIAVPMVFRMAQRPDGKWRIERLVNLRAAYQKAERIFDDYIEKARIAAEERAAKAKEEQRQREAALVVLPEPERREASLQVYKMLHMKKAEVLKAGEDTRYRFISYVYSGKEKELSLAVYNDFMVADKTGATRNAAAFVLAVPGGNIGSQNPADFDEIRFFSSKGGFAINVAAWEKVGLGAKGRIHVEGRASMAFLTTTDGLGEVYKLMSNEDLRIVFYKDGKTLAMFRADKPLAKSIEDAVAVNDVIKGKLMSGSGQYTLFPVSEEAIADAIASDIANNKEKAPVKEASSEDGKKTGNGADSGTDKKTDTADGNK